MSKKHRATVIGSGFGGLATAIRLQAAGIETVIFESMDRPGGRASAFHDKGFTFDRGPTVITAPESIEEIFRTAGAEISDYVTYRSVEPFYRLRWHDGDEFDYGVDLEQTLEQIRSRNTDDADGYMRFLDYSRKNFESGYNGLVSTAFLRFWDMAKVAPKLLSLRSDRPVYRSVERFIKDERLRQAMSFHTLLIGGHPFETSSIYTLIHTIEREWGVHFPVGGTGALIDGLVKLFQDIGGEIRLSSKVERVDVRNGVGPVAHHVTAEGWDGAPFDVVVSNADLHHTYGSIYGHLDRGAKMARRLERMHWSMSLFVLYFGTSRKYSDLKQHTIIFGPRYKELIDDIFHGDHLPEDFSIYLHAPTVTDPSLAPEGCETFYALSPVPHLGNADIDWDEVGPSYADRILESLESFLPDLRQHIVTRSFITPNDFRDQLGAYLGNAFSVAPLLTQSAYMRPHNRDPKIPGLYLAGAGTHPGAGVPGVINSGKATARVIMSDLGVEAS